MAREAEQPAGPRPDPPGSHAEGPRPGGLSAVVPEYPRGPIVECALDLLFPPTCAGCGRPGRWICARCWDQVLWLSPSHCGLCDRPTPRSPCPACGGRAGSLDALAGVAVLDGVAREAVHALKYEGHHAIGGMLGRLMARVVPAVAVTIVAPVSLHSKRRRERGYDQAAILARSVARELDLSCNPKLIRRIRYTKQQTSLGEEARLQNVAGAFEANAAAEGEHVLLIDDVMTTGATMGAAADALKRAGAASVIGLVFALA